MRKIKNIFIYLVIFIFIITSCNISPTSSNVQNNVNVIVSLGISKLPDKLEYNLNEVIDLSGGELNVEYSDGTIAYIPLVKKYLQDDDYFLTTGSNEIKIAYSEFNKTYYTSFYVRVNPAYYPVNEVEIFGYDESIVISNAIKTFSLYGQIKPDTSSNQRVNWSSSDASVASINQDGLITILKPGLTKITLSSQDNQLLTDTLLVQVVEHQELAAISSLIEIFDNYYSKIKPTDYSDENFNIISLIYEETILKLNTIYEYKQANIIYLAAVKQIAEVTKNVVYYFNPYPTNPSGINYATFTLTGEDLVVTSEGLVNPTLIGINTINDLTIAETVGDGTVTVESLTVEGVVSVYGGGEQTVRFTNVNSSIIKVNKAVGEIVKVEINGGTHDIIEAFSAAKFVVNTRINRVIALAPNAVEIIGQGEVVEIITVADVKVALTNTITNLLIDDSDRVVNVEVNGNIINLVNDAEINLYGVGTVDNILIHNSLNLDMEVNSILVPCDCPLDVNLTINANVNELNILKANTTVTGTHSIVYVTLNIDPELVAKLNTPNTIFNVVSGSLDINGFIYSSISENATDENGNFTCSYCLEVYRTLVLNKLNALINNTDSKVYTVSDWNLILLDINDLIDQTNSATTPLEVQAIDNQIPNILEDYVIYKYFKEFISYTVRDNTILYSLNTTYEIPIEDGVALELNYGKVYFKNNLDQLVIVPLNYVLKTTTPVQQSLVDLSIAGEYSFVYVIETLPSDYLNSNNLELSIDFNVIPVSDIQPVIASISIIGDNNATILFSGNNSINYRGIVKDQFNQTMIEESVVFELYEDYPGISITSLGVLTISPLASPGEVIIVATSINSNSIFATKNIALIDEVFVPTSIIIYGPTVAMVNLYSTNYVEYTYAILDQYSNLIDSETGAWSIIGDGLNVINGEVEIPNTATVTSFEIIVTSNTNNQVIGSKVVSLVQEEQIITSFVIGGVNSIKLKNHGNTTTTFTATVYDQYDVLFNGAIVLWSLSVPIDGISVDENTGLVTLADTVTATSFTIRVTSGVDAEVWAEKTVAIT